MEQHCVEAHIVQKATMEENIVEAEEKLSIELQMEVQ